MKWLIKMERSKKHSYKRDVIFKTLQNTDSHPTAEWIYRHVKEEIPDISLGTVYRNLSEFKAEGKIRSVGVVNGQERFDARMDPHSHFICENCGAVLDMGPVEGSAVCGRLENETGVRITAVEILYKGLCANCVPEEHCV